MFLKFSADQSIVFNGLQAQVPFFSKNSVCLLFMAKLEFLLKDVS